MTEQSTPARNLHPVQFARTKTREPKVYPDGDPELTRKRRRAEARKEIAQLKEELLLGREL